MLSQLGRRLLMLLRRRRFDADLEEEMRLHRELREQEKIAEGLTQEEAHYAVSRRFGNPLVLREESRDMWGWNWLENLLQDVRYALRMLAKYPGSTAAAVITLALGIGANTALFSVVNAALFRPLAIQDASQVFSVAYRHAVPQGASTYFAFPDFTAMREQAAPQLDLAAYDYVSVDVATEGGVQSTLGALVSGNYFKLLGLSPILGRDFAPDEDQVAGASPVALISERLWRNRFHSDATATGRTLRVNGRIFTIIGVMPADFTGTVVGSAPDVWVPTVMWQGIEQLPAAFRDWPAFDALHDRGLSWANVVLRLHPGVSQKAAEGLLKGILQRNAPAGTAPPVAVELSAIETSRLPQQYAGSAKLMMSVLLGSAGVLLLLACANTASLLMGRTIARRKEIAIRFALGARRSQVMAGLVTESAVIAAAGGCLGIFTALWAGAAIESWRPIVSIPIPVDIGIDSRVLAFAAIVSALSGLAVGIGTALHATSGNVPVGLNEISATPVRRGGWLTARDWLVAGQLALSLSLLAAAGLLLRTLVNLESIDVGFDARNLIVLDAGLTRHGYSESAAIAAYPDLLGRLRSLPGVESAALAQYVPLGSTRSAWRYGEEPQKVVYIDQNAVSPEYFRTMGIPLVAGREFTDLDRENTQPVAIVNETMAHLIMHTGDPIGKTVSLPKTKMVVVGVARDNRTESLRQKLEPWSFVPFAQSPAPRMSVLIKTRADARWMIPSVRRAARLMDSSLPDSSVVLMTDKLQGLLWQPRSTTFLVGAFAGLAALLAMVGVYGTVSFHVSQRLRDLGIRMAFGASRFDILRLVVGRALAIALIGAIVGEGAATALTGLLRAMLYGVQPRDPVVFVAAPLVLIAVAALSSFSPARRATKVDPMVTLRYE